MNVFSIWSLLLFSSSSFFLGLGGLLLVLGKSYVLEYVLFSGLNPVGFFLIFDWVGSFFLGLVFFISSMVMRYSKSYMGGM